MARYEETIEINAPPEAVWPVMADVTKWPEWTPSIPRVEPDGTWEMKPGARAKVWVKGGTPASDWVVTQVDPGRSFTWETRTPGTRAVAGHVITATGSGSRVTLTIDLTGPFTWIARPFVSWLSKRNLKLEAEGLKRRSEAVVTA